MEDKGWKKPSLNCLIYRDSAWIKFTDRLVEQSVTSSKN